MHFTALRKDAKSINLSNEVYIDRKIQALKKMESMLNYAESITSCRNLLLLQYFEEQNAQKCGHCDVCITEKKAALSNLEVQKMSENIIALIQKEPITLVQLIENFKQFKEEEALEVLQWLQDINQVEERNNLLYITEKQTK